MIERLKTHLSMISQLLDSRVEFANLDWPGRFEAAKKQVIEARALLGDQGSSEFVRFRARLGYGGEYESWIINPRFIVSMKAWTDFVDGKDTEATVVTLSDDSTLVVDMRFEDLAAYVGAPGKLSEEAGEGAKR